MSLSNLNLKPEFQVPSLFVKFYSYFPLVSYPPILSKKSTNSEPTLWILPPRQDNFLSADVECLKWQAYLALRGLTKIKVRWDIAPEGSLSGSLPNLHIPSDKDELLGARAIPAWVDAKLGVNSLADPLEGYIDKSAMIESRAWVSLLEGIVHATLVCFATSSLYFILTGYHRFYTKRRLPTCNPFYSLRQHHPSAKACRRYSLRPLLH